MTERFEELYAGAASSRAVVPIPLVQERIDAFDLVVESMNVQALTGELCRNAIAGVTNLVAPGGTLLVIEVGRDPGEVTEGPPWPLDLSEVEGFGSGLVIRSIERIVDTADPAVSRWVAEFVRETE